MKYCPSCTKTLDTSLFYKSKGTYSSYCKSCWKIKVTSKQKKPTKEKLRDYILKHKFNIPFNDYMDIYNSQGGRCAICGKEISIWAETKDYTSVACVDHNHTTGEVRGLLCNHCNTGIGLLQENPVILNSAINYLLEKGIK
mgnify:CR=1 FL=1